MARTKDFDEDEVLEKAMDLFWNKGYNGTSMQDLVDGLGISRSSLYDTYTDKHTLFIKSLDHYKKKASAAMTAIIEGSASAKETISRIMDYVVNQLTRDAEHKGCFLVNSAVELASHDQEINRMLCENDRQMEGLLIDAIEKGKKNNEITNTQSASSLAQFIFNNIKGMRVTARATADKKVFDEIAALTLSILT
jgi:TetR/AcrR family transcriptional repressor of nem operon